MALKKLDQKIDGLIRPGSSQSRQAFQKNGNDRRIEILSRRQTRDVDFGLLGVLEVLFRAAGRPLFADVGFHFTAAVVVVVAAAAAGVVVGL